MSDGLPEPWWKPDEANRDALRTELLLEVSDGHPEANRSVALTG